MSNSGKPKGTITITFDDLKYIMFDSMQEDCEKCKYDSFCHCADTVHDDCPMWERLQSKKGKS